MSKLLFLSVLTIFLFAVSCEVKDPEPKVDCTALETQLEEESIIWFGAALTYGFDPTAANCQTYRQATLDYIEFAAEWRPCADDKNAFDTELADIEATLADLDC